MAAGLVVTSTAAFTASGSGGRGGARERRSLRRAEGAACVDGVSRRQRRSGRAIRPAARFHARCGDGTRLALCPGRFDPATGVKAPAASAARLARWRGARDRAARRPPRARLGSFAAVRRFTRAIGRQAARRVRRTAPAPRSRHPLNAAIDVNAKPRRQRRQPPTRPEPTARLSYGSSRSTSTSKAAATRSISCPRTLHQ